MANVLLQIGVMPTKQLPANTGRLFARAPENISEDSVGLRVVATSMSTWLVPGAAAGTGTRTPLRVEQPPRVSAKARPTQNLREAEVMTGSNAGDGDHFDIACSSLQVRLLAGTIERTADCSTRLALQTKGPETGPFPFILRSVSIE
jgi:hypothetical protein